MKGGTSILSISVNGADESTVSYYSSGTLTETPNTGYEAQSVLVTVYAIRGGKNVTGSYKTLSKVLRWNTTSSIYRFRYTNIRIECTAR